MSSNYFVFSHQQSQNQKYLIYYYRGQRNTTEEDTTETREYRMVSFLEKSLKILKKPNKRCEYLSCWRKNVTWH